MTSKKLLEAHPELEYLSEQAITIQNRVGDKIQIDYLEIMHEILQVYNPECIELHGGLAPALEYYADWRNIEVLGSLFLLGGEEPDVIKRMEFAGSVDVIAVAQPLRDVSDVTEPPYDEEFWDDEFSHYVLDVEDKVDPLDPELIREYLELHKRIMSECTTVLQ